MTDDEIRALLDGATPGPLLDTMGRRNRKHRDKNCAECGTLFRPKRADSAYCSRPCARKKNGGQNAKDGPVWWINSKGYVEGRVRIDGKQRRKKYHRHVMETVLGRELNKDEDVHHINGNKLDNRPENLMVLSHSEHSRISSNARRRAKRCQM